jgi:hypothetical protein
MGLTLIPAIVAGSWTGEIGAEVYYFKHLTACAMSRRREGIIHAH